MNTKNDFPLPALDDAVGEIPYNMTNDYMFRAVLQQNKMVLSGLIGALLHLDPESLDVEITNPIELGKSLDNKTFVLDICVTINSKTLLNLEMQVINYNNWKERSLSYLCRSFDNVYKGSDYTEVSPIIQISFLDFVLFPEAPEFYSTYMMSNVKNHIIYTDKLRLSVVQLSNIKLATDEDRLYQIDKWAALFKAKTWKELKTMAASNQYMKSAVKTLYELSADQVVREQCRAREEYEAYERYRDRQIASLTQEIEALRKESADKDKALTDKDKALATQQAEIAKLKELLNKKN